MTDQPPNPDPDAVKPGPEDSTRRDSEAMLGGKPSRDPLVGTTVDQYSIKRVIGEGGMGVVYEALQQSPRRTVALKMMKRGVTSKSAMRRFEYEAQTLGRLRHDGIAQIYQAGTWDDGTGGRPWFAMEYIQGAKTLTRYCKDKKLGTRERLDIFSKVCAAVQHGHAKGIIHRDLKPGNILVTSSGVPKVIDFGVARSTDSDLAVTTLQTDVGALIGTLQYMSPEQCDADPNDIDIRSDVYALGVVLYELLCDQPPYALRHAAIHEAARIIREEEPTKPSSVDKRLRGDIETIALKALEKDRDRRYQSATALEEDIDRYLAGDPIAARPMSMIYQLSRFSRKHRGVTIAAVSTVLAITLGSVIAAIGWREAELQKQLVVAERDEVEARNEILDQSVSTMLSGVMQQVKNLGNSADAQRALLDLARDNINQLVVRDHDTPLRRAQLAQVWLRIARSHLNTSGVGYGSIDEADSALDRAVDILDSLDPAMIENEKLRSRVQAMQLDNPKIMAELQRSRAEQADTEPERVAALQRAAEHYRQRSIAADAHATRTGNAVKAIDVLYSSSMGLGHVLVELDDRNAARASYETALRHANTLVDRDTDRRDRRLRDRAIALYALATLDWDTGTTAARTRIDEAVEIARALIALAPDHVRRPRDLGTMLALRGKIRVARQNEIQGGIDDYRESVELFTDRAVESPREPTAQQDFETTILDMMAILAAAARIEDAQAITDVAVTQLHCIAQAESRGGRANWIEILARINEATKHASTGR